jgi:hypothetical protein
LDNSPVTSYVSYNNTIFPQHSTATLAQKISVEGKIKNVANELDKIIVGEAKIIGCTTYMSTCKAITSCPSVDAIFIEEAEYNSLLEKYKEERTQLYREDKLKFLRSLKYLMQQAKRSARVVITTINTWARRRFATMLEDLTLGSPRKWAWISGTWAQREFSVVTNSLCCY